MALMKTWYTPDEVEDKYGVKKAMLLEWVREGLVRCEREGKKVTHVNIDDVKLEIDALVNKG